MFSNLTVHRVSDDSANIEKIIEVINDTRTQDSTREIQEMIGKLQNGASRDLAMLAEQLSGRVSVFRHKG